MKRIVTLALSAAIVVACGSSISEPTAAIFTLDYPRQGSAVASSPVAVGGMASPGGRVVRDISFAPDQEVVAGADGRWEMFVELQEGANELVFRLGDQDSTETRLGLTFAPVDPTQSAAAPSSEATPGPPLATATLLPTITPVRPTPTPVPAPTPTPAPTFRTFGDGIFEVGVDIRAGTYRLREPAGFCYWARLKGFDGTLSDIIANQNVVDAYGVVTIKSTDAGFESSGCDQWSSDLSRVTESKSRIDYDGTFIVGTDISAGKWKSTGGDGLCYWARLSAFTGTLASIIANGLPSGPTIVTIRSTDKGFTATGCGTWTRQ